MNLSLKKLNEQVIIITGATSGIGLTTARMAAEKGAKLVLVARNGDALRELSDELSANGTRVIYAIADVADETALRRAAEIAKANFGGFDTWVNNAGGSVYGRITDVPTDDLRRLFETNVWGVVNGSRIAVEHLREQGGALINVGSEVSDAPVPLQGMYSASKHAVKGFTDALRMELEADNLPISVTLIKPTAINTPFPENAKNYLPYEPQLPQPLYAPELVAEAILHCAENPVRDFFVGEMAKAHSSMALNTPRLYEKMNESMIDSMQNSGEPAQPNRHDGLYKTNSDLRERGAPERFTLETSVYQKAKMRPILTGALAVGAGLGLAVLLGMRKSAKSKDALPDNFSKISSLDIREKMEVFGADNVYVGMVDRVEYGEIKLARKDSPDGKHHMISADSVEAIDGNRVMLSQTSEQARQMWRTIENVAGSAAQNDSKNTESTETSNQQTDTLSKSRGSGS
jgi:short-subunit dehydrogenase